MRFISVSGFGWSGSSAVVDLLREFEGFKVFNDEFRIIKDPGGILDLEILLIENWDQLRSNFIIKDYIEYCNVLDRPSRRFFQSGYNYSRVFNIDFNREFKSYLNEIILFTYEGSSLVYGYQFGKIEYLLKRLKKHVFGVNHNETMYLSRVDKVIFINATMNFIEKIFQNFHQEGDIIVLDQAIPANSIVKTMNYFNDN